MTIKKIITVITIFLLALQSFVLYGQQPEVEQCYIQLESMDTSSIRKLLYTSSDLSTVSKEFLADTHTISALAVEGSEYYYIKPGQSYWKINTADTSYNLTYSNTGGLLNDLSELMIVYALTCPDSFTPTSLNSTPKMLWIKDHGQITFTYYSFKCEFFCLPEKERLKVAGVIKLFQLLE